MKAKGQPAQCVLRVSQGQGVAMRVSHRPGHILGPTQCKAASLPLAPGYQGLAKLVHLWCSASSWPHLPDPGPFHPDPGLVHPNPVATLATLTLVLSTLTLAVSTLALCSRPWPLSPRPWPHPSSPILLPLSSSVLGAEAGGSRVECVVTTLGQLCQALQKDSDYSCKHSFGHPGGTSQRVWICGQ